MSWPCVQWLRDIEGFPRGVKPVAHALALRVDDNQFWRGTAGDLAADAGCSIRTVNRVLKWMDGAGMTEREDEYNPTTGHKVRQRIRFVMLDELPSPLRRRGGGKTEETPIKDTLSFRPVEEAPLKDSVSGLKDKSGGPKGHHVRPKGHHVPSSTTLPTHTHTHPQGARAKTGLKNESQASADVAAGFERFLKAFPRSRITSGRQTLLGCFSAECERIHPRPAVDLAIAAESYSKSKGDIDGLSAEKFLVEQIYEHHLPKRAEATAERDLNEWARVFEKYDLQGQAAWPAAFGPPPGVPGFRAPYNALGPAWARSTSARTGKKLEEAIDQLADRLGDQYLSLQATIRRRHDHLRGLSRGCEWPVDADEPDPRKDPRTYPGWLLAEYGIASANQTAA